ncbi:MAG: sulfatase-like hydrolase/transferase [Acidobacteria bacterium]|nr:sulfatase-like hydrolase/transferase [Acidobacteriota bacterium]
MRQSSLSGIVLLAALAAAGVVSWASGPQAAQPQLPRPNILWITSEDNGPELGAYGDAYATTPSLDRLAARGFRYRTVWSNGPVCAASRTALILGVYPESTGGEHMRSYVPLPGDMRLYPALLRDAGYYTTNSAKADYNYGNTGTVWDEQSNTAHYRNRPPGQPFFAVFNSTVTHESQIRTRPHKAVHDPAGVTVPAYMPDVPVVRQDWAQYYDRITEMDTFVGLRLAELDADGLAGDTIVMYFGDHGSGMPRSKRFPYDSGLRVPLIVYVPPKYQHLIPVEARVPGAEVTRLVSFVDFAPTLLSLAGVAPPAWMQGHAFLGPHMVPAPGFIFGFRGRMDERYDLSRSVRDARYVYIRNYMPHRPWGQHVGYMFETPATATWKRMYDEGRLNATQRAFWEPKPHEELYDLDADRWQVDNLAESPAHAAALARLREALDAHQRRTRDVGLLPEYMLHRDPQITPYALREDRSRYDFERVQTMARQAADARVPLDDIRPMLADSDPAVRYWAATGVVIRGRDAVAAARADLVRLLGDGDPGPRIAAAEGLARFGSAAERDRAIARLVADSDPVRHGEFAALLAAYSLNQVTDLPAAVRDAIDALPATPADAGRTRRQREEYLPRLKAAIRNDVR